MEQDRIEKEAESLFRNWNANTYTMLYLDIHRMIEEKIDYKTFSKIMSTFKEKVELDVLDRIHSGKE